VGFFRWFFFGFFCVGFLGGFFIANPAIRKCITAGYFYHTARLSKAGNYKTVKHNQQASESVPRPVKISSVWSSVVDTDPNSYRPTLIFVSWVSPRSGLWIRIHFSRIRIRIQSLMLETNTDPDPDPIRIQGFNDQKLKKNYS
jgi:hypothetical protein